MISSSKQMAKKNKYNKLIDYVVIMDFVFCLTVDELCT